MVDANPSTTEGTIKIMEYLGKYVPHPVTGHLPILCNGDGLSIERMVHAKRGRANAGDMVPGLQHLVESPQEFHKEMILLQVMYLCVAYSASNHYSIIIIMVIVLCLCVNTDIMFFQIFFKISSFLLFLM